MRGAPTYSSDAKRALAVERFGEGIFLMVMSTDLAPRACAMARRLGLCRAHVRSACIQQSRVIFRKTAPPAQCLVRLHLRA